MLTKLCCIKYGYEKEILENNCIYSSPGGEEELLPGLVHVDDVDAVGAALVDVLHHGGLRVFGPDVRHGSQHLGDVGLLRGFDMTIVIK